MTTARASDDGDVTAVFFFWRGRQRKSRYLRLGITTDSWRLSIISAEKIQVVQLKTAKKEDRGGKRKAEKILFV